MTLGRRALARSLLGLSLCACATTPGTSGGSAGVAKGDPAARVRSFERTEDEILRDLATLDRRVAVRGRIAPSDDDLRRVAMEAVLAEDPTVAILDGAIDPFSFAARERGLGAVRRKLADLPEELPRSLSGTTPSLERELLARLVEAERLRLEEERALPRSASALVRAVTETWRGPSSPREAEERDRVLARRLAELRVAIDAASPGARQLDGTRARELDDALDALEHLVDGPGFTGATAELVRVRDSLERRGGGPARATTSSWADVGVRVRAHLGVADAPDALDRALSAAEARARALAEPALAAAGLSGDALAARLEPLLFAHGPCVDAVPGSRVRSMAPPPEREPACHLRHAAAAASDDASRALALAALHDHVVVARWALDLARGAATAEETATRHRLLAPPSAALGARLERMALARPATALGAGLAAALLLDGAEDPRDRARRWSALGDVPLDVARSELAKGANAGRPAPPR